MLSAEHMRSLPQCFSDIPDPRRSQGRRHSLSTLLAIATAAVLCGARGYIAISDWSEDLGQKARARFRCRYRNGRYLVPSRTQFREVLIRVDPSALDRALQNWNAQYAAADEGLAIDGKTMCNAIDGEGRQTHILAPSGIKPSVATPKKVAALPVDICSSSKTTRQHSRRISVSSFANAVNPISVSR